MWGGHPARPVYASLFVEQFINYHQEIYKIYVQLPKKHKHPLRGCL
ncbi:hypothetical protein GXM_04216 [Nostoc sphaeroides CCNUC1]|uniref:Uncharacterized protein n=1 Tax=Nostoc sphaeroides CCNUC1 TaxID=2653204 RepID=A0A5P8W1Y2_9NOSO|nr:hypothetical protein GXM_04216 [Nostoc sphaeroides CCNUC1]